MGGTPERIGNRTAVAESKVEISFPNSETKDRCLAALDSSDRRLAMGPKTGGYDWQAVSEEALFDGSFIIRFGVAWYDSEFYREERDVYFGNEHRELFASFGIDPSEVKVSHWEKVA
ncbi:hypothetical protein [Corynebacterium hindlerae]|uniref:hypothetical protein n=1 Tax=Corynebacterium hindlerae TaxID=699041 RepID=UPI0031B67849